MQGGCQTCLTVDESQITSSSRLCDPAIPKKVMQTWKTSAEGIPEHWKSSPEQIALHMPDWEYTLMTDEMNRAFVAEHFPDFLETFDNFPHGIQRADAIRVCWLYVHGGLYMDLDLHIRKPIQHLFCEEADLYVVRSQNFKWFYTNAFMASKAKHPFWLIYLDEMKKPDAWWAVTHHLKVLNSTGPLAFTRSINRALREGMDLKIHELPDNLLSGCSVCDPKPCQLKESYIATLEGSSWVKSDGEFFTWVYCRSWRILFIVLIVVFIIWWSRRR